MNTRSRLLKSSGIPESLKGRTIQVRDPKTHEEYLQLVADGKQDHLDTLAGQQFDIILLRVIESRAGDEDVAKLCAEGRVDEALAEIAAAANSYTYGAARVRTGESAEKRKAQEAGATVLARVREAKAAGDHATLKKFAALGVDVDSI